MRRINLLLLFFFLATKLIAQTAADNEPTLSETVSWLRDKINTYCTPTNYLSFSQMSTDETTFKDNANLNVSNDYKIIMGLELNDDGEAKTLSLYDVTGYDILYGNEIKLYSKEKKVQIIYKDGNSFSQEYETVFAFSIKENSGEENLSSRFAKALARLVALNNQKRSKEAF